MKKQIIRAVILLIVLVLSVSIAFRLGEASQRMDYAVGYAEYLKSSTEYINFNLSFMVDEDDSSFEPGLYENAAVRVFELGGLYQGISGTLSGESHATWAWGELYWQMMEEYEIMLQAGELNETQELMIEEIISINNELIDRLDIYIEGRYEISKLNEILNEYNKNIQDSIIEYDSITLAAS